MLPDVEHAATLPSRTRRVRSARLALAVAIALAVWGGSRDMFSEDAVSTQGDMSRYLMNGVFLRDLATSGEFVSWSRLVNFAEAYYARYPALSLGHHAPVLPAMLAPAFGLFGVSVLVGRAVLLATFVVAVCAIFALTNRLYGWRVAGWTAVLFASHPAIVQYAQQVLSEMPMLAFVLVAVWQLSAFVESGRMRHFVGFALAAALSLGVRPTAVVALPAYLAVILASGRVRRLLRKEVLIVGGGAAALILLLVPLILAVSPANVQFVLSPQNRSLAVLRDGVRFVVAAHLQPLLWVAALGGVAAAIVGRDRRILVPVTWSLGAVGAVLLLTGSQDAPRYTIVAVPAFCLAAGALTTAAESRWLRWPVTVVLAVVTSVQIVSSAAVRPTGASGYETAARWIVTQTSAPTVMFSGPVDTGYFVFFMRKHDPARRFVVLRSDKIFTTSMMHRLAREERIASADEIDPLLQRFGTRFIVIEDLPLNPRPLVWFHEALKTSRFVERLRIPQQSRDRRLRTSSLVIYEFLGATAPDPLASVDIHIPLVGRRIEVPLADLLVEPPRTND